ncbi:MAG: two-component system, NarL family, sensor kinase [Thermoleophilaceae bacterium]|jgi:signal transduction histidine kinase|nr:two-component system, NarL family, sensor kinase [Thermoleophilaceae bacterium]
MKLTRVPVESIAPVAWFGLLRIGLAVSGLVAVIVFEVPQRGKLLLLSGAIAVPWAIAVRVMIRRDARRALNPLNAVVDLAILAVVEVVVPESYAGVCFLVVFIVAAHAQLQGEQLGVTLALLAIAIFVPIAFATDGPASGGLLAFYEVLFAASVLSAGLFMGRLRTAESTGRLRARELSRRTLETEGNMRRRLAESLHDGPVQELVSLDMMLDAARRALERDKPDRAAELIEEARHVAERNIGALRDEMIGLGPYAFDELTVDAALEQCVPTWARRYGIEIGMTLQRVNLANEACGSLFGIAQEAVVNAGRHSGAKNVSITLRTVDGEVELRVSDDGSGFDDGEQPLGPNEPGHIGLATMRERAELIGGRLEIRTGEKGSTIIARVPLERALNGAGSDSS